VKIWTLDIIRDLSFELCFLFLISKKKLMQLFEEDTVVFGIFVLNIARELARRLAMVGELLLHKDENK
jgi:hypothetical protein